MQTMQKMQIVPGMQTVQKRKIKEECKECKAERNAMNARMQRR